MLSAVRRSLRTKVVIIVLVTTFAALLVSTLVLLSYDVDNYRDDLVADATTQADILARINAPTLAFDDPKTAETNLALLNNRPNIRAAAIYIDGRPLVRDLQPFRRREVPAARTDGSADRREHDHAVPSRDPERRRARHRVLAGELRPHGPLARLPRDPRLRDAGEPAAWRC